MFPAIVLGIVQGLTEFLPISSSGHLVLAQYLFGFRELDPSFNVFVQGGTVLSVLLYFRHTLPQLKLLDLKHLLVASLPAALAGILLSNYLDQLFSSLAGITLGFAFTTLVVWFSRFLTNNSHTDKLTITSSFKIGLAQAAAILPGFSRSGSTITASLALGIAPLAAFNFSFLLSIPTITGAALLSIPEITWTPALTSAYLAGFFTAALTGYYSLVLLAKLMKQGKFYLFAPYTALLTLLSLALVLTS